MRKLELMISDEEQAKFAWRNSSEQVAILVREVVHVILNIDSVDTKRADVAQLLQQLYRQLTRGLSLIANDGSKRALLNLLVGLRSLIKF